MTTVRTVTTYRHAAQYTGSNSADLAEAIPHFMILAEADGALTFDSGGTERTMHTGDWVLWTGEGIVSDVYDAVLTEQIYRDLPAS